MFHKPDKSISSTDAVQNSDFMITAVFQSGGAGHAGSFQLGEMTAKQKITD